MEKNDKKLQKIIDTLEKIDPSEWEYEEHVDLDHKYHGAINGPTSGMWTHYDVYKTTIDEDIEVSVAKHPQSFRKSKYCLIVGEVGTHAEFSGQQVKDFHKWLVNSIEADEQRKVDEKIDRVERLFEDD